jgi:hypothetical protein
MSVATRVARCVAGALFSAAQLHAMLAVFS